MTRLDQHRVQRAIFSIGFGLGFVAGAAAAFAALPSILATAGGAT